MARSCRLKSSKKNPGLKTLSELEGVCLGLVFKYQPCTAYRVRQLLKESPSSHWCASAGSVYPLLARLEEAGSISTETDEDDGRGSKQVTITARGREELRDWMESGAGPERIAAIMDPIRSRTFFLDVLGKTEQKDYLERLIYYTKNYLAQTEEHLNSISEADDLYDRLGACGAVMATEARLRWLTLVLARIETHTDTSDSN